ncbi:MAG: T9SS type A sorting domain-containing protein, partial [Ignavibacteriales bacterium]|nr:T9SS type A sorting domain-containing protein [Ignavibacteriales bacterium]
SWQSMYTFDVNGNCTFGEFNRWIGGSWQLSDDILLIYYNNRTNIISFYANTVSVTYTSFTNIQDDNLFPNKFSLSQNYPNPFNPSTIISYQLPIISRVTIKIFNVTGQEILTLLDEEKSPGVYNIDFNASQLSSGVYIYQMKAGEFTQSQKMILIK